MKGLFTAFVILISCQLGVAQIAVELVSGIEKSFRILTDHDQSTVGLYENRERLESPKRHYRFGVNALIELFPALQFKTGLRYAEGGYFLLVDDYTSFFCGNDYLYNDPEVVLSWQIREIYEDYVQIELPIQLRWSPFSESIISPFVEAGVNPHLLTQVEYNLLDGNGDVEKSVIYKRKNGGDSNYRTLYFVAVASVGTKLSLGKSLYLTTQFSGRYSLNELKKVDDRLNENFYSLGGELAIGYQFGD